MRGDATNVLTPDRLIPPRFAPAEETKEATEVRLPVAVRAATLDEAQREVQEAEEQVKKAKLLRQKNLDKDIKEELQHVIAEVEHASQAEAEVASATAEAEPPLVIWGSRSKGTAKPKRGHLPIAPHKNVLPATAEGKPNVQGKAEAEKREAIEAPQEEEEEEDENENSAIQQKKAEEQQEEAEEQQENIEKISAEVEQAERTVGGRSSGKKPQIT